jgi:uncharacterized protein
MKAEQREIYKTNKEIRRFFEKQEILYLERTRIEWKPLLSRKLDNSPYFRENQAYFKELNRRYGEQIERAHKAPLYIRRIDEAVGYGVFAAADIGDRELIGEYAGVVQVADEKSGHELETGGFESDYAWYYLDEVADAPDLEINGRLEGNELRFVNHSQAPNLEVEHTLFQGQWIVFFIAARPIKKDEQLMISYGEAYWEDGWRDIQSI